MEVNEVVNFLRFPMSQLNERFAEGEKQLEDFMGEALEWCNKMKMQLELQNKFIQPTLENLPGRKRRGKQSSAVTQSTIHSEDVRCSNLEESIAGRTRRARKAMQNSKGTCSNPILSITNEIPNQRRTTQRTNANNARTDEALPKNYDAKKRKVNSKDGESSDNSQTFVKPKNKRGRKPKAEKPPVKTFENTTLEESQFFNSPILHTSSPKATLPVPSEVNNPKVNSPKSSVSSSKQTSPRVSLKKSPSKVVADPSPVSISSDFITDSREETEKFGDKEITEKRSLRESRRNSVLMASVANSPKFNSSKNAESTLINDSVIDKTKTPSPVLATPRSNEDTLDAGNMNANNTTKTNTSEGEKKDDGNADNENNTTKTNTSESGKKDDGNADNENETVTIGEGQLQVQEESSKEEADMRMTRSRPKASLENSTQDVKPQIPVLENLNVTKTVIEPLKTRTRPVKPKILNNNGELIQVKVEVNSIGNELAEKTYLLRSSTGNHSNKLGTGLPDENSAESPKEPRPAGRTKKTKGIKQERKKNIVHESAQTERITRTKSKKAKEAADAAAAAAAAAATQVALTAATGKLSGLTILARKSLNKAKIIAIQQEKKKNLQVLSSRSVNQPANKITVVSKLNTPKNRENFPGLGYLKSRENIIHSGKGKYLHLGNERVNALLTSGNKRNAAGELLAKFAKENEMERELKLKALKEKEEEAKFKRDMVLQNRQKELKEKNEMKLLSATKMRQKIEMEKHINIVQSEKEKEAKRKLLLEKRELRLKEKAEKKKMMLNQKLAETEERRRLEEEARIAKIKEQEAEQQRIQMGKEKEIERHQKWAQERAADEQAREKYEMKIKEQQMKLKMMSSKKPDKPEANANQSKYKPRNENDFGLEDEHSEVDSDEEEPAPSSRSATSWAKEVLEKKCPCASFIPQEVMSEYMACHSKTPDIHKMFKMTPRKRIQRTSSAIWNTPSS